MASTAEPLFPYLDWFERSSTRSSYCLSQAAMPAPDAPFLALDASAVGAAQALPLRDDFERRLAGLFGTQPEHVLATAGASNALATAALAWFRPGTRVLYETPTYEPIRALAGVFGAEARPLTRRAKSGWRIDPNEVDAHVATDRPTHVVLSNPHNPSGALLSAPDLRRIADSIAPTGGKLVSCEAYMEFAPTPEERVHAAAACANGVSLGSLSKAYGLAALRCGWLILGAGLADERVRLVDRRGLLIGPLAPAGLEAARRALDHLPQLLQPLRRVERETRPHFERWLRECPDVVTTLPPFGISAFPRIPGVSDTRALARELARRHDVDVVPGEFFGAAGHLRVSCGLPAPTLQAALERLELGLRAWRAEHGGAPA